MNVGEIRKAIEGLGDDEVVVLHVNNVEHIGSFEEIDFRLDWAEKRHGERPGLILIAHAFDIQDDDDDVIGSDDD